MRRLVRYLPNLLSLARLAVAPVTIWLILDGRLVTAFWMFAAAALTDAIDGILARWLQARTALGSYLDPIADKSLLVGTYLALTWMAALPVWLVALVVARDIGLVLGVVVLHFAGRGTRSLTPSMISKLNTVMQIALVVLVMAAPGLHVDASGAIAVLIWVVAATTTLSAIGYLRETVRRFFTPAGAHA
ncbi:CDP-alcohol phosphatidyltransferase family protein [Inquilinus limosus]|uniref:CDP-alcohol phosphatidyltransferase family protein n=1 Tax=Inquilinus limosus TaxID=171674 RepID=UPI000407BBFD|nr:CDP-alcohol phosphatidyltransferase family protein [Inquilinus limosus]